MILQGGEKAQTFLFKGIGGQGSESKKPDACYYVIETPSGAYETAKITITFWQIENLKVHLFKVPRLEDTLNSTSTKKVDISDSITLN